MKMVYVTSKFNPQTRMECNTMEQAENLASDLSSRNRGTNEDVFYVVIEEAVCGWKKGRRIEAEFCDR